MRTILPPIAMLVLLAGAAAWNARTIDEYTAQCISGIDDAIRFAAEEDWPAVRTALSDSQTHWQNCSSYLRITVTHSIVDAADSMYCRALAFAETEELMEFQAETAGLRFQLLRLAENERFRPENIF